MGVSSSDLVARVRRVGIEVRDDLLPAVHGAERAKPTEGSVEAEAERTESSAEAIRQRGARVTAERDAEVYEIVRRGSVDSAEIAEELGVTAATVTRSLQEIA